jgi:replicative DNA helicase
MMTENEAHALSIILNFSHEIDLSQVNEELFLDDFPRKVFRAARAVIESGGLPEALELYQMDKTIDAPRLMELYNLAPTAANFPYYLKKLREAKFAEDMRLALIKADTLLKGNDPAGAFQILTEIDNPNQVNGFSAVKPNLEVIAEMHRQRYEKPETFPSGLMDLDFYVKLRAGNLAIIAARPSEGKTALAIQFALNYTKAGFPIGFVSLEMSQPEIIERALKNLSGSSLENDDNFVKASDRFTELPFHFITPDTRWPILKHSIEKAIIKHRLKVVFVDFVQLLSGRSTKETRANVLNEIISEMKAIALTHKVLFIVLSQMNRTADGTKAGLNALRDAGGLEAAADVILFIERAKNLPKGMIPTKYLEAELFLSIEKNRSGQRFKLVPVVANFEHYQFLSFASGRPF